MPTGTTADLPVNVLQGSTKQQPYITRSKKCQTFHR